jgi:hypothetical protein
MDALGLMEGLAELLGEILAEGDTDALPKSGAAFTINENMEALLAPDAQISVTSTEVEVELSLLSNVNVAPPPVEPLS